MRLINHETFLYLDLLIQECIQLSLTVVHKDLVRDISDGCKFTILISQRNFLDHLIKSGGVTHEIMSLAKNKYLSEVRVRKEELHTLKVRIKLKEKEIRKHKYKWIQLSKTAEKPFIHHAWLRDKYRNIKRNELNRVESEDKVKREGNQKA